MRSGRGHVRVAWLGVERRRRRLEVVLRRLRLRLAILDPRPGIVILLVRPGAGAGVLGWLAGRDGGVHVRSEVEVRPPGGGRGRADLGVLVTPVNTLRDPITGVVGWDTFSGATPPLPLPTLLHPATQGGKLLTVVLLVVTGRDLELVPVDVQHGRHEARVVGELALDVLHGAAVEQVAAPAVFRVRAIVIDDGVTEREGTTEVKTSRQTAG